MITTSVNANLDAVMDHLRAEGYQPSIGDEDEVRFKYEGKNIFVDCPKGDQGFVRLGMISGIDINEVPAAKQFEVANKMSSEYKVVKMITRGDIVLIMAEFFIADISSFCTQLERALHAVVAAYQEAGKEMFSN